MSIMKLGRVLVVRWTRVASKLYRRYIVKRDEGDYTVLVCRLCNAVITVKKTQKRGLEYLAPVLQHFRAEHIRELLETQREVIEELVARM